MTTQENREAALVALLMEQGYTLFHPTSGSPFLCFEKEDGQQREVNIPSAIFYQLYEGGVIQADDERNSKIAYEGFYRGLYYRLWPTWELKLQYSISPDRD